MKGTFFLTLDYLKELGACEDGQVEFQRVFPDGGEYQEVLDRCAEEGRTDFGRWLLDRIGPTDDVRVYDDAVIDPDKVIMFAGRIECKQYVVVKAIYAGWGIKAGGGIKAGDGIKAGGGIKAGWDIEAGWGIKAGQGIEAGRGIKAGRDIEAGEGYGVFAGLNVRKPDWETDAVVTAQSKPDNLRSGFWKPRKELA